MATLDKATYEGTFNHASTGLFKNNTAGDIGADDARLLVEHTSDSVPFTADDSYTWPFPQVTATGTDAYAATAAPVITAYATGQKFQIKFTNASSGVSTLNLNAVGAKKIYINPTTQATTGHIVAGQISLLAYDAALDAAAGGFLMLGAPSTTASTLAAVLAAGNDATGLQVKNIFDGSDPQDAVSLSQMTTADGFKAPLASPTFTGTPAAPTPSVGDNDTSIATTAFVQAEIAVKTVGVQDLFVPASAMWPRVTSGCAALTQLELATSVFNIQVLAFDQTSVEYAQFLVVPPRKWNNGTITIVPYWTAQAGTGTVRWSINGGMYRNDDALTVAFGSAQTSDDTLLATNDLHIGPATSAITLAGTGQDENLVAIQIARDPANDTLNADALLLGISIRFTTNAAIDA
jgi:hypothetical protein